LKNYNYSQNGMYFVTICTNDHEHFFGEVLDGKMILNDVGKIIDKLWQEIPKYFPFVRLDAYQVMPNHIHGNLIIIQNDNVEARFIATKNETLDTRFIATNQDAINLVSAGGVTGKNNPMINSNSLAKVIRWYKGRCSFEIRHADAMNRVSTIWQPKFYDHIIRNDESLNKIREYIINNPKNWEEDKNKIENIFM